MLKFINRMCNTIILHINNRINLCILRDIMMSFGLRLDTQNNSQDKSLQINTKKYHEIVKPADPKHHLYKVMMKAMIFPMNPVNIKYLYIISCKAVSNFAEQSKSAE